MTKRQAAGTTLCLLFGQASPLVYCAAERSKVEGPIARALIYHTYKGSKVSLSWLRASNQERFPRPFLRHHSVQIWQHISSQEVKVLNLCLAFR